MLAHCRHNVQYAAIRINFNSELSGNLQIYIYKILQLI